MKELLFKVLNSINSNKELQVRYNLSENMSIMDWHNSAGNHLFDDNPDLFGITENDGHQIRVYFQSRSYRDLDHIREMIEWGLLKDKRLIPDGHYCYSGSRAPGDKNYRPCPFWSMRKDKDDKSFGYCSYLEKGDNDFTRTIPVLKKGQPVTYKKETSAGLLWDQVKECRSNNDEE